MCVWWGQVTAKRFNRGRFMAELKVKPDMLGLLASIIGNDYVPQVEMRCLRRR